MASLTRLLAVLAGLGLFGRARLASQVTSRFQLLSQVFASFLAPQALGFALGTLGLTLGALGFALRLPRRGALLARSPSLGLRLLSTGFCGTLLVPFDGINCQRNRPLDLDRNRPFGDAGQVSDEAIDGTG
ncbi:MAG: hypothetical protein QM756_31315 [Polyangiaceae bacterium]